MFWWECCSDHGPTHVFTVITVCLHAVGNFLCLYSGDQSSDSPPRHLWAGIPYLPPHELDQASQWTLPESNVWDQVPHSWISELELCEYDSQPASYIVFTSHDRTGELMMSTEMPKFVLIKKTCLVNQDLMFLVTSHHNLMTWGLYSGVWEALRAVQCDSISTHVLGEHNHKIKKL